jgi:hypothetical protein
LVKLKINKETAGTFVVDAVDLPGSPPVGRGRTVGEAMGNFLMVYQERLGIEIVVDTSVAPPRPDTSGQGPPRRC